MNDWGLWLAKEEIMAKLCGFEFENHCCPVKVLRGGRVVVTRVIKLHTVRKT